MARRLGSPCINFRAARHSGATLSNYSSTWQRTIVSEGLTRKGTGRILAIVAVVSE